MKTYMIRVNKEADLQLVLSTLQKLADDNVIDFMESWKGYDKAEPASEDQAQEIIDESELGPYYSEDDAKRILNL